MIRVIHQLTGRIRFRIDELRGSDTLPAYLEKKLARRTGIARVSANAITGSLLVRFDARHHPDTVTAWLEDALNHCQDGPSPIRPSGSGPIRANISKAPSTNSIDRPLPRTGLDTPPAPDGAPLPWHCLTPKQVVAHFATSQETGLTEASVTERQAVQGKNVLPGASMRSFPTIIKNQFTSMPVLLISGAAGLSFVTGRIAGGILGLVVSFVNAAIGSLVEMRAELLLRAARETTNLQTRVLREGQWRIIPFEEVVTGDVIHLETGSRVPADAKIIRAEDLGIDESALTGESVPVLKSASPMADEEVPLTERRNMLYRGTLVVEGRGRAVAVAVGKDTVLGRLQRFLGEVAPPEAVMARDLKCVGVYLIKISLGACSLFMAISLIRGYGLLQTLRDGLSLAAGTLPSGLSTLSVSGLALAYREMRQNRILIRRLRVLGNLSTVQVVCFDKTGTLTRNRMTVTEFHTGTQGVRVEGETFVTSWGNVDMLKERDISWLIRLSVLCNEATMGDNGDQPSLEGSSTEKSLIDLARRAGMNPADVRAEHPMVDIIHRTDEHPFMMTVHRQKGGRLFTAMKGSAPEVLERCSYFRYHGRKRPLTDADLHRIEAENLRMAGRGLRVLGVAYCRGRSGSELLTCKEDGSFCWAGLIGLEDPLRNGAKSLIKGLHGAGIRTAVITGDQSLTAQHIGEQLGLSGDEPLRILETSNFNDLEPSQMSALPTRAHVFARLNPKQKLQIIQAFQKAGMSVAMVGDGINDVLALRVADVGIAMGKEGAELARQTADLVLENDDLLSILAGIAGGRAFYLNMGKSLRFLLTTSHADILTELSVKSGLAGQSASVWQGVWTNLACFSLAMDPSGAGVMDRPPRGVSEGVMQTDELKGTVKDAMGLTAVAGAAGGCGRIIRAWGPGVDGLFTRSVSINELLYALPCRDRGDETDSPRPPNRLLGLTLSVAIGGYLLSPIFRGIGGTLGPLVSGLVQTALLGAGALTSLALLNRRPSWKRPAPNEPLNELPIR